jgi:thiol-disulfide isomerase/thioredoxin
MATIADASKGCQSAHLAANPTMAPQPESPTTSGRERWILLVLATLLAVTLLWLRGGLHPQAPLEKLARQSLDLPVALANGRPTIVEFYADWCQACQAMAPAMDTLAERRQGQLNVVLLNVDNPRWQAEIERFQVNGIPQLDLFSASGQQVGRAIGARSAAELAALSDALLAGAPLPKLAGVGELSRLNGAIAEQSGGSAASTATGAGTRAGSSAGAGPRSHG